MNVRFWPPLGVIANLLVATVAQAEQPLRFDTAIKPIMERHCVECHSGWFPSSSLRLDTREHVLEGGKQGRAVIPGQPDKGWLINMIVPQRGLPSKMPPGPAQLSAAEIAMIRQWIAEGAQ